MLPCLEVKPSANCDCDADDVQADKPTGETPAKKFYPEAPAFTATASREAILEAHRRALVGATPVKTSDVRITLRDVTATPKALAL